METKENVNQEGVNTPIVSSRTFFDDIDKHFECYNQSEEYRKATHKFEKGRKLYLEIEVQTPEMSTWLYKWLYGKDSDGNNWTPFGCSLDSIHFSNPTNDDFKRRLIELAESL